MPCRGINGFEMRDTSYNTRSKNPDIRNEPGIWNCSILVGSFLFKDDRDYAKPVG